MHLLGILPMLLADGAGAQSSACDQLKGVLSARIEATGIRAYTLEAVPAGAPVPPDAKVIGNCESGAMKILYRKGGAAKAAPAAARDSPVRPALPAAAPASVARLQAAAPAVAVVPIVPAPSREPDKPPAAVASAAEVTRTVVPVVTPPPPPAEPVAIGPSLLQQASDLGAEHWRWLFALLLVPIAAWGAWVWRERHSAYDASGLPRGPKF